MVSHLAYTTDYTVYDVVPDDHYLATDSNTLQYYIDNFAKYFTSHTQLVFQPGKYYLHTDLIVQNVSHITLRGLNHEEAKNTIIYCIKSVHISISNSNVTGIAYLTITKRDWLQTISAVAIIKIFNCLHFYLWNSLCLCQFQQCGLEIVNVAVAAHLKNITSSYLLIVHNTTTSNSTMIAIDYYHHIGHSSYKHGAINVCLYDHSQHFVVKLFYTELSMNTGKVVSIFSSTSKGSNVIYFSGMVLTDFTLVENAIAITIIHGVDSNINQISNTIQFIDCHFSKISISSQTTDAGIFVIKSHVSSDKYHFISSFSMFECTFYDINSTSILQVYKIWGSLILAFVPALSVLVENTMFSVLNNTVGVIWTEGTILHLLGPTVFTKVSSDGAIINVGTNTVNFGGEILFSLNQATYCIVANTIIVQEYTKLDIIANNFSVMFYAENEPEKYQINELLCLFQYDLVESNVMENNHSEIQPIDKYYSIILQDNNAKVVSNRRYAISHCDWIDNLFFIDSDPLEINKQVIHYVNNSMELFNKMNIPNDICYCTDDQHPNCSIDELGPVYPGQTFNLNLMVNKKHYSSMNMVILFTYHRACKTHSILDQTLLFANTCTKIPYDFLYKAGDSCNLYLLGLPEPDESHEGNSASFFIDVYYVKLSPCPLGFALSKPLQICQCDPVLKFIINSPDICNINTHAILRPANSWIAGRTNVDNSHIYQVSLHCPFDYCLPHSSYLNLSNPDSQCQFNRTGVFCERCKEGLSAVFGTSQCKQCSNHYLFLLLLFIFVGFVFMMFLFIFNFTVADGSVNGLVFYANIVSINGPVFFPSYEPTKYVYVLISFLNLDLGIEVCFYNGMDDYAKMWLQLIFPIYLIFIATLLIRTSRYSTRIQRFTAHRALPVLATLFLLSYTKILRTVSSVLFSYSTIISLPSKNITLVWSVDTEVQLFGLKFIVLFIVCLVLFLILLPFNAVLIFTRTLSKFKCINHFKPLLDAYQVPYKDGFYFWTGLQLLLRAVFYGISALDRNTNMMIGILILGVMECMYGSNCPFKSKSKNHQELMLIFNLQSLFAVSLFTTSNSIAVITLVGIAMIQFVIFMLYQMNLSKKYMKLLLNNLRSRKHLLNIF